MNIKIQAVQRDMADKISLKGSIFTLNGGKFDLDKLTEDSTLPVYKQVTPIMEDEVDTGETVESIHVLIQVSKKRFFMFHSGNLKRFFDIDSNNIIDLSEFKTAIDYINETDDVKLKANLKAIRDKYLETHTRDEWNNKGL